MERTETLQELEIKFRQIYLSDPTHENLAWWNLTLTVAVETYTGKKLPLGFNTPLASNGADNGD